MHFCMKIPEAASKIPSAKLIFMDFARICKDAEQIYKNIII